MAKKSSRSSKPAKTVKKTKGKTTKVSRKIRVKPKKTKTTKVKKTQTQRDSRPLVVLAFIVFALLLVLWVINWGTKQIKSKVEEPLAVGEVFSCVSDSDCTTVPAGCCGCSAGGRNIAINKKYEQYWRNRWLQKCGNTACATVISQDKSCSGQVKCLDSLCQIQ